MKITLFNTTFTDHLSTENSVLIHSPNGRKQNICFFYNTHWLTFNFSFDASNDVALNVFILTARIDGKEFSLRTHIDMDCIYLPNRFSKDVILEDFLIFNEKRNKTSIPVFAEEWVQIAATKFEQKFLNTEYPLGYPFNLLQYSIFK